MIPFGIGWYLTSRFAGAQKPNKLYGMTIAASGWFCIALFGSLPFTLIAWTVALDPGYGTPTLAAFLDPLNGFFESMSGFTGTGLTMTDDKAVLPPPLQWWRSFSEWIGGSA